MDLLCLGLKSCFCNGGFTRDDYNERVLDNVSAISSADCSPELAHQIIYGGIKFAAALGFEPDADYEVAQYILDPIRPP